MKVASATMLLKAATNMLAKARAASKDGSTITFPTSCHATAPSLDAKGDAFQHTSIPSSSTTALDATAAAEGAEAIALLVCILLVSCFSSSEAARVRLAVQPVARGSAQVDSDTL